MNVEARPAPRGYFKAMSIERLCEWAFGDEKAQLDAPMADGRVFEPEGYGIEYVLLQIAALGCQIDTSGPGMSGNDVHWDAETVAAVVAGVLPRRDAETIAAYARAGTRPSVMRGAVPKVEPLEWIENQHGRTPRSVPALPSMFKGGVWRPGFQKRKGRDRYEGFCTPVTYNPSPQQIRSARDAYGAWWSALQKVRERLIAAKVLRSHTLIAEMPPATPWLEDDPR